MKSTRHRKVCKRHALIGRTSRAWNVVFRLRPTCCNKHFRLSQWFPVSAGERRVIVTLVHGTFATDAEWTRPTSFFCSKLVESFGPSVVYERFQWDGKNSSSGRVKAAKLLSQRLKQQRIGSPDAVQCVVGHSHGGNVALKAVSEAGLFNSIPVVCLSTPFVSVNPRYFGDEQETSVLLSGFFLSLTFLYVALCYRAWFPWDTHNVRCWLGVGGLLIIGDVLKRIYEATLIWAKKAREALISRQIRLPAEAKILIVQSVGDEANTFIRTAHGFADLLTRAINIHAHILERIIRKLRIIGRVQNASDAIDWRFQVGFLFVGIVTFTLDHYRLLAPPWSPISTALSFLLFFALICVFYRLAAVLVIWLLSASVICLLPVAVALMATSPIPFGFESLMTILFFEETVEVLPVGNWQVLLVRPTRSRRLNHSSTYDDPDAIKAVASWIRQQTPA